MIFIFCLVALTIVRGLVYAAPASSPVGTLLPRAQAAQAGETTSGFARLRQPTQHRPNEASSACTFSSKENTGPTASFAYINPTLLHPDKEGNGSGSGTGLCGAPIIVTNPLLNKEIATTVGGSCGDCSPYDIELSEAAWGELTGSKSKVGGLEPGSVWKDGKEEVGVAVQW